MAVDQMGADLPPTERTLRLINYEINRSHLRSAMKKREKDFGNRFLGKKVSPHVGPWALTNHPQSSLATVRQVTPRSTLAGAEQICSRAELLGRDATLYSGHLHGDEG
ncbi:hypothetical protein [Pseudomonas sp. GW456-L15]|uniref:hypothetical protein n=1 Tax=Pseudomonas sp. GW456-L15 TaxID=2751353 RepID=UPI001A93A6F1|nr:hypothetical protein [Pseudomonas sp. GW456-L15]